MKMHGILNLTCPNCGEETFIVSRATNLVTPSSISRAWNVWETQRREPQMALMPKDPDFYFIAFLYLGIAVLLCG